MTAVPLYRPQLATLVDPEWFEEETIEASIFRKLSILSSSVSGHRNGRSENSTNARSG